jgi:hypothetical protein
MANPVFITVANDGGVYFSMDPQFVPSTGTAVAVYRVYSSAGTQKLGTISGNTGAYAASGSTGKFGRELT